MGLQRHGWSYFAQREKLFPDVTVLDRRGQAQCDVLRRLGVGLCPLVVSGRRERLDQGAMGLFLKRPAPAGPGGLQRLGQQR